MFSYANVNFLYCFIQRYCPGGPDSDFEYSTQSYTGYEVLFIDLVVAITGTLIALFVCLVAYKLNYIIKQVPCSGCCHIALLQEYVD